jgi:hypothetical protein
MPPRQRTQTQESPNLSKYQREKNYEKVVRNDLSICWCQGITVGCGRLLHQSQRAKHRRDEEARRNSLGMCELNATFASFDEHIALANQQAMMEYEELLNENEVDLDEEMR